MIHRKQRMSRKGRQFLIREEGVRQYAYNDSSNNATFGVGHLLHLGPVTGRDLSVWGSARRPSSMLRVNRILKEDLVKYEDAVRDAIGGVRIRQNEFDACVSLCFNIGTGGFASSTVAHEIRASRGVHHLGFFRRAGDAFLNWANPPVLLGRRQRERVLFRFGRYQ